MHIETVNNTRFSAGNVYFRNFETKISSFNAIKKIAKENNIDFYITNIESQYLPGERIYTSTAKRTTGEQNFSGTSVQLLNKKADPEEIAVKVYNASIYALESLNRKIKEYGKH